MNRDFKWFWSTVNITGRLWRTMTLQHVAKPSILGVSAWANLWLFMLNRSDLQDSHGRLWNNNPNYERPLIPTVLDKSASLDMELQNDLSYQWCHLGSSTAVSLIMAAYCISPCPGTSTRDSFPILCGSTIPPTQPVAVESTKFVKHACPHLPMFHVHVPPANPFLFFLYNLATSRMVANLPDLVYVPCTWGIPRHSHQHGNYQRIWVVAWAPL